MNMFKIENSLKIFVLTVVIWASMIVNAIAQPVNILNFPDKEVKTQSVGVSETTKEEIVVGDLEEIAPDSIGLIDETNGGFPSTIWNLAKVSAVMNLFAGVPDYFELDSFNNLSRKLLLTTAQPPMLDEKSSANFFEERIKKLVASGMTESATKLASIAGQKSVKGDFRKAVTKALLIDGNIPAACSEADIAINEENDKFWEKLMVFCRIEAKENDKAILGITLLRDQGYNDDAFYDVAEYVTGIKTTKPEIKSAFAEPINALIAFKVPNFFDKVGEDEIPVWFYNLAIYNQTFKNEKKIELIEKSVAILRHDIAILEEGYTKLKFKEKELSSPLEAVANKTDLEARALLYQATKLAGNIRIIPEIIAKAFARSSSKTAIIATAKVYASTVENLEPSPELTWFTKEALVALFYGGRLDSVVKWLENAAYNSADVNNVIFKPFLTIIKNQDSIIENTDYLTELAKNFEGQDLDKNRILLVVYDTLSAFNIPISYETYEPIIAAGTKGSCYLPDEAKLRGIEIAADEHRTGEVVLMILNIGKNTEIGQMCSGAVRKIITSLIKVNLETEAKYFAVEMLINNIIFPSWHK